MADSIFLTTQMVRKPDFLGFGVELFAKNLEKGQLVMVSKVLPGSPAEESGLRVGDNIIEVNGINVIGEPVALTKRRIVGTGEILNVRVRRQVQKLGHGGLSQSMRAREDHHFAEDEQLYYIRRRRDFKGYGIWTKQDISLFGVRETFVSHVEHNSPAYSAGIKTGDQILKIDHYNLENSSEEEVDKLFSKSFEGVTLHIKRRERKIPNGTRLSRSMRVM